jgi:hypothetical protein
MLRVTVEIWPGGDKTRACAIAIANVANVSDLVDVSERYATLSRRDKAIAISGSIERG